LIRDETMKYSEYRTRRFGRQGMGEQQRCADQAAQKDMLFYTQGLISLECLCGREKLKGNSLCRQCYKALPDEMQKALYRKLGHGYEEALDDAVKWLQENRW